MFDFIDNLVISDTSNPDCFCCDFRKSFNYKFNKEMDQEIKVKVDESFANSLLNQFTLLWITPEIQKRKDEGKLPQNFILEKAQVLFCLGSSPIIRLNEEVKVKILVKVNRNIKKGELVYAKDISDVAEIKNVDEEQEFAFLILVKIAGKVFMAFNFKHDISQSKGYLDIGISFLDSARGELTKNNMRQMVELLFISAENLVKARIYLFPDQRIRNVKRHGRTQQLVNFYAKTGKVIKTDQKDAFNRLIKLRDPARYDLQFSLDQGEAQNLLSSIDNLSKEISEILTS